MKVYLEKKKHNVKAVGEYDKSSNSLTVLSGSLLSADISYTEKFRGSKSIANKRESVSIVDNVLQEDVPFKSPSTAGNFVTGRSTDGLTAWKDENGRSIKEIRLEG